MTPEQFCYWFQGFAELSDVVPNQTQWDMMRAHINTVFDKKTERVCVSDILSRQVGPGVTGPVGPLKGYNNDFTQGKQSGPTLIC